MTVPIYLVPLSSFELMLFETPEQRCSLLVPQRIQPSHTEGILESPQKDACQIGNWCFTEFTDQLSEISEVYRYCSRRELNGTETRDCDAPNATLLCVIFGTSLRTKYLFASLPVRRKLGPEAFRLTATTSRAVPCLRVLMNEDCYGRDTQPRSNVYVP